MIWSTTVAVVNHPCALQRTGMPAEVRFAQPLPLAAVATLGGRRTVWVQVLVFVAVRTLGQFRTAGVLTWFQCFLRHYRHLLLA